MGTIGRPGAAGLLCTGLVTPGLRSREGNAGGLGLDGESGVKGEAGEIGPVPVRDRLLTITLTVSYVRESNN